MATPEGAWLRETRERQRRADGEPWSQDDFIDEVYRATGWRLYRSNVSKYETGASKPTPATFQRLVDFWTARGEAAPDLRPPEPPLSDTERLIRAQEETQRALREQAEALRLQAAAIDRQTVVQTRLVEAIERAWGQGAPPTPVDPADDRPHFQRGRRGKSQTPVRPAQASSVP